MKRRATPDHPRHAEPLTAMLIARLQQSFSVSGIPKEHAWKEIGISRAALYRAMGRTPVLAATRARVVAWTSAVLAKRRKKR